ncbi:MAG: hypothetical protein ACK5L6_02795 [Anaerorhabdus sp.]|uniref:hypothetical protein n=1 Tax=Anaerorhabdus sp. TaxID=1872524 RepID=UPI003A87A796
MMGDLKKGFHRGLVRWRDGHREVALADDLRSVAGIEAAIGFARAELVMVDDFVSLHGRELSEDDLRDARYWRQALEVEVCDLCERAAELKN